MKHAIQRSLLAAALVGLLLIACQPAPEKPPPVGINALYADRVGEADIRYLAHELENFKIYLSDIRPRHILYKNTKLRDSSGAFLVYALAPGLQDYGKAIDSVKAYKTLVNGRLPEYIMFHLKIGDKQTFDIKTLRCPIDNKPGKTYVGLSDGDYTYSARATYYYYQDMHVYKNPEKDTLKSQQRKFVMIDTLKKEILYYTCSSNLY